MIFQRILIALAVMSYAFSHENQPGVDKKEKYNLSICAIFKNESKYLKEWIEYHRIIGVDHFYLYSNNSTDRPANMLHSYLQKGIVTLIHWPDRMPERDTFTWSLGVQTAAYENAIYWTAKKETKWLAILDIDEFLVPLDGNTLADILEKYNQYPGIVFSRTYFNASSSNISKNLVIESTERIKNPIRDYLPKKVEKMIFKPAECCGFMWPPYRCRFKDNQKPLVLSSTEMRVNHYSNRGKARANGERAKQILRIDQKMMQETQIDELVDVGYMLEDLEGAACRFAPEVRKRLGY